MVQNSQLAPIKLSDLTFVCPTQNRTLNETLFVKYDIIE